MSNSWGLFFVLRTGPGDVIGFLFGRFPHRFAVCLDPGVLLVDWSPHVCGCLRHGMWELSRTGQPILTGTLFCRFMPLVPFEGLTLYAGPWRVCRSLMFVAAVFISQHPHGRIVSPHCNVSLRVFTIRRARKYKEALENSANMYTLVPDDADIQEEIDKKISRLQRRRPRSKHKQQLLAKKEQSIVEAGQGTSSESSSSSSMSDA